MDKDILRKMQFEETRFALYEAFKRSNDVMFYCDHKGVILDVNEAFVQKYGYTREEAIGKSPRIVRSRHSTDEFYKRMWTDILNPQKGYWKGEIINRTKDGREIPMILTITSVLDAKGNLLGYVSNSMDMTELMALRSRVAQSEALAGLGEMAAVVAHEIRNPLGSIVMAAKQLAGRSLDASDQKMVFDVLRKESQRLNEVLSNFLAYARPRDLRLERGNLNAILEDICRMLGSNQDILNGAALELKLDKDIEPFPMDSDQMRQVAWNIVLNALQAMKGKGVLKVATGREKDQVFLRIQDTGPGIDPKTTADIFKPFYTTKQQGTGLGLAIADRIIKSHGGRIEVKSRPGDGAQFTVYLPVVRS